MSSPALISIEKFQNFELYKHSDGNPEATLAWLEYFNEQFTKYRGSDPMDNQYRAAQLVRSSIYMCDEFNLEMSPILGWGIEPNNKWGADYHYILKLDGTVEVLDD